MNKPEIFIVKPEQVGSTDLMEFLRTAINKEYEGKDFYVGQELSLERTTHYSPNSLRRLKGFCVCEEGKSNRTVYFDVTDVPQINWIGR